MRSYATSANGLFVCKCSGLPDEERVVLTSPPQTMPCPAWFVQPTDIAANVNMHVVYRKADSVYTRVVRRQHYVVELPVLVNIKSVKAGTELFYYRAPRTKAQKRSFVIIGSMAASDRAAKVARAD